MIKETNFEIREADLPSPQNDLSTKESIIFTKVVFFRKESIKFGKIALYLQRKYYIHKDNVVFAKLVLFSVT